MEQKYWNILCRMGFITTSAISIYITSWIIFFLYYILIYDNAKWGSLSRVSYVFLFLQMICGNRNAKNHTLPGFESPAGCFCYQDTVYIFQPTA